MGILTWIIIAVLILSIIGLGWQTFISGVFKGGEKIINSTPEIKSITDKAKQYLTDGAKTLSEELINNNNTMSINQSSSQSNSREKNTDSHTKEELFGYNSV
jgi:uncharacterized membrane protein